MFGSSIHTKTERDTSVEINDTEFNKYVCMCLPRFAPGLHTNEALASLRVPVLSSD